MPLCGECRFGWKRETVMMLRTPGEQAPVKGAPDLPEGLQPFESTVIRAMRRATVKAAAHERARIVAWVRQQKTASWPDLRDLAEAIRQGEHHLSRRSSNVYVMEAKKGPERPKTTD
jgi:hypothetical protein